MNELFDAITKYVDARLELLEDKPRQLEELRTLRARVASAEAELREVCSTHPPTFRETHRRLQRLGRSLADER